MEELVVGKFRFPIKQHDALVWLDVKHCGDWHEGVVAGGYGIVIPHGKERCLWGFGGVASTELLYLHGLAHIIHSLVAWESSASPSIVVFAPAVGFRRYFELYETWQARGGKSYKGRKPEAYEEIEYCYRIKHLGKIEFIKVTAEDHHLPEARDIAWRAARLGAASGAERIRGIVAKGEGTDAGEVMVR